MSRRRPDPIWSLEITASGAIHCDESLVNDSAFDTREPTPEEVLGPDFIQYWSTRLEAKRATTVETPVTPERLTERLLGLGFFASAFAMMSAPEPDGAVQISEDQRRTAKRHLEKVRKALDGYIAYRRTLSDELGTSLLPSGEGAARALKSLNEDLEHIEVRPRARGHYELLVKEARAILLHLTGTPGRIVGRETGVESGLLFHFSLALLEKLAPGIDPIESASRIKTAIRARR